jgi:predicted TIM-barrel fold metal-dependent hydrolase
MYLTVLAANRSTLTRRALFAGAGAGLLATIAQPRPRIWDIHCHLTSVPGATPEERMNEIVRYMDRMGIERVILSLGYPLLVNPPPDQLREENDQVLRAVRHRPDRAYGFVYLNPNYVQASLDEFNRCVRDGPMVGVKLWVARRCSAPELDPMIERAVSLNAPIMQHTWLKLGGKDPGESTPQDVVDLARRHPAARLVCGHTGGNWELGLRVVRPAGNLPVEIAGSDPTSGFLEMAVRELGPGRVIYGSDAWGRSFASQLAKVMGANLSAAARNLVLGENLRRLMAPMLRAKGLAA